MSPKTPVGAALTHESGRLHATGAARYVDDLPEPAGLLFGHPVTSPVAHGRLEGVDADAARAMPGVHAVLTAADVPGVNDVSPTSGDEPLLAVDEVHCVGQVVALAVADTPARARAAAAKVALAITERPAILEVKAAIAADRWLCEPQVITRGDAEGALARAPVVVAGEVETPGQDHFYLETQAALAIPGEDGSLQVFSSTQHPSEVQGAVAEVLGLGRHQVVCTCPRMGGGFGGKETQAAAPACLAALAAAGTGRPVKVRYDRDQDMTQTGGRHPWWSRYRAGFDEAGHLLALEVHTVSNGGWSADLSKAVLHRCLFHLDNAYFVPDVHLEGRVARTNLRSNTAFRGFGGPQGMAVIETVMNRAAERLGLDPAALRRRNYYGAPPRDRTPYGQAVVHGDNRLERITEHLFETSHYAERRAAIDAFNRAHRWTKRGLGFQPVKFGISFTTSFLNQAGAYLLVYADGTVQLNHGGTEMGQGLYTKMQAVCAAGLGVPLAAIRHMPTATDKVPNTSATAASSGADLNGQAVADAAARIQGRLRPVAAECLGLPPGDADRVVFEDGRIFAEGAGETTFAEVCGRAYLDQVPLSATGYYRTPGIHYDEARGRGEPFHYFAYGAAVVEVEVSGLTGEHRLRRVDILHDVGESLVPTVDRGQIEGGFLQGLGWLTVEELKWDDAGRLLTHGPSTYKVPALGEAPVDLRVQLLPQAAQPGVIHGSKAVGEPPFMLALGAVTALRHAVAGFGAPGREVPLALPATPEAVLRAVTAVRAAALEAAPEAAREGGDGTAA